MRPSSHSAAIFGSIGSDSSTGRPWSAAVCATFDAPNTENVSPQCGQTTPLIFSTSPRIGTFIIDAIRTAFSTIIATSSCGEATTTMPSTGSDWNTVSGTSPVPGGMSTNIKSTSLQMTSVQNCLTVPAMTGPRQTTGSPGSSSSRLMDITCTPSRVSAGRMPSSQPSAFS